MRKDIEIHIQTGDVAIIPKNAPRFRTFRWVEQPDMLSRYIYCEIDVPYTISESMIINEGVYFKIPYTPIYKEMMLRIRRVKDNGVVGYIVNKSNHSHWFKVKSPICGRELKDVYASELPSISEEGFYIKIDKDTAVLYSSSQSDFNIILAGRQNANCLLACFPGSNYRYPLTGVGLARWIGSNNVATSSLTTTLQSEFSADGVRIKSAAYNYDTKQMELDAKDLEV